MRPTFLGLSAVGWNVMLRNWWDKLLAGFLLATVVLGSSYILYRICCKARTIWRVRHQQVVVPTAVARYITRLNSDEKTETRKRRENEEPKSFGVYLGEFNHPPSPPQARLLCKWDILVLDPTKNGVLEALSTEGVSTTHILGRLDVRDLVKSDISSSDDEVIKVLSAIAQALSLFFGTQPRSPLTGVLLANYKMHLQPVVLNEMAKHIHGLGLDLWLEIDTAPSACLTERQCRETNMEHVSGLVYRNGTIRPDGDRQNYFQMSDMRQVMRAVAAQRSRTLMTLWETIDDGQEHRYSVIQRTWNWCRFSNSLCWIGSTSALTDADAAAKQTVDEKPLGALMWLKGEDIMKAHDFWRANDEVSKTSTANHETLYDSLSSFIPGLTEKLRLLPPSITEKSKEPQAQSQPVQPGRLNPSRLSNNDSQPHPLSTSAAGDDFTGLGCFHLGLAVAPKDFADLLLAQRHLRELDLLLQVEQEELRQIIGHIKSLHERWSSSVITPASSELVKELLDLLTSSIDDKDNPSIRLYTGLHSGFSTSSKVQFWGLYDVDASTGVLDIYLSSKTQDRAGTVLHTFLSSRGCSRAECFVAEHVMADARGILSQTWQLSPRILQDVEQLSPEEAILFLRRLILTRCEDEYSLLTSLRQCCEYQLMEIPTLAQLRTLSSTVYLSGQISPSDLITARLSWLSDKGCWHPDPAQVVSVFEDVDARVHQLLMTGETALLAQLGVVIQTLLQSNQIDARADVFALSVFCAFRKLAVDEIYLEVLDRNPLPNHAADQAACFSENFALGSRCESFFDTTARGLGRVLSDRYRSYYMKYQPPPRIEGFTDLPSAYAPMQIDLDPQDGKEIVPAYYQITFLGIFAVPALIDIMLLTTIGRGLYLTTFMSSTEKTMATTALMLALLVCGAVGSWITSGGCYYLYANAFPAMNMFCLTRFVAGIAIVLVGGFGGFVVIVASKGIIAALVFVFYFTMLTTYLLTLAALSIYQVPGTSFQSGRTVIMFCIPILFISPIVSLWTEHDIAVYFCVLSCFLMSLLFGARKIMSQWSTFYLNIPHVTDAEVVNWFIETRVEERTASQQKDLADLAMGPHPRKALHAAVLAENDRHFWTNATSNQLVSKLAAGYSSTMFLMSWYCRFKRTRMPLPYSATWNLTLKAGVENMTNMQKGLKLHGSFLHWRHTGSDIMSGLLYFVVALLDKWAALMTGGAMVGLSAASSAEYRLSVGFGLCYYLIGAVSLDTVSQPLWTAANENTNQPITSLKFLRQATVNDAKARRALYWKSLAKFFFMHIWGAAITSALMWTFEGSRNATIMYLGYLGAYTGLLWYQYNKIFCVNDSAKCLTVACVIGLPAGIVLHLCLPHFAFSGAISLAIGTWIAAIYSMRLSKIGWPSILWLRSSTTSDSNNEAPAAASAMSYFVSGLEPHPEISQSTLSQTFEHMSSLHADQRYVLDPSQHPGLRVVETLVEQSGSERREILHRAFPSAKQMLLRTVDLWTKGQTVVELIPARHLPHQEHAFRSISRKSGNNLHILIVVGLDLDGDAWTINIHRNRKIIAESVVQATSEAHLGLSHQDSMLAELLVVDDCATEHLALPEGVKRQLETSTAERSRIIKSWDRSLLRYFLLGIDCDRDWDNLPWQIRSFLLKRCCGQSDSTACVEETWIRSRILPSDNIDPDDFVARCNLGATLILSIYAFAMSLDGDGLWDDEEHSRPDLGYERLLGSASSSPAAQPSTKVALVQFRLSAFSQKIKICIKFICLALTADPEYQRELHYMIHDNYALVRWPVTFLLNGIWSFCKMLQGIIIPLVLFHGREKVSRLHSDLKGMKTVFHKSRIVIESLSGPSTCFLAAQPGGANRLSQYSGRHEQEPSDSKCLVAVNTYTDNLILRQREEFRNNEIENVFTYEYRQDGKKSVRRLPIQRQCLKGDLTGEIVQYDERGYISTGSTFRGVNPVKFTFWYRTSAKFEDELLRGEYVFPHITIRVSWSMPGQKEPKRLDEWIPFTKVTEATFVQGSEIHHASWTYEHKSHPEISTTLNGQLIATPAMIRDDWFHVLKKPSKCGFLNDNPLLSFSGKSSFISRVLGLNVKRYPISTSQARTQLWKTWKSGKELDAVTARWLDEGLLRSDGILNSYWRNRDFGRLDAAKDYLGARADTIMARVDVDPEISSWVHIAYKISDFYSFGQGGDSRINTRTLSTQLRDSDDELHILAMDTSTWPNEPGGVSACRRDMVNDLKTIRWHVVAESANDYGVPKFQIERNVQSLTVIPQWGLDFLNPTHGILENIIDSAVVQRSFDTRAADIEKNFLPILTSLVRCSRTLHMTRYHIEEATKALCDLNTYFETSRNWNDVWDSDIVKQKWRELWLDESMEDTFPISQWWDFEKPTMLQMDQALNLWHRYLFIFSIPVPEKIPDVFQASHHFTGATYGIICKVKRQCTLHIWDHCISFRELTNFMSSAVSFDTPFINSSLISLGLMGCILLEHHADVVLPCAAYFNPGWEIELGTAEGVLEHRRTFARKIDPVVNGICNMERFEPIENVKTDKPTAVMLSHVQYIKDIKNAILATDYIVNKWGFSDYSLHIYGDMERAASYSTECQELIASKGLRDHCVLKGLGNPSLVLQDAWLFLNSSLSEGLPLAMGEAALTGTPVVCTDVGASFCVVTDGETGDRFSEVVPPNDSESLARAQISVLGLLGRWSAYAEDPAGTPPQVLAYPNPSPDEVKHITKRMYDKTAQRRRLGMLGRENVLKNFSSDRYLREHEQMLWIGKHRSRTYHARTSRPASVTQPSTWLAVEKSSFGVSMVTPPLHTPRMTPDSWSLSSQLEKKGKLRKKNPRFPYERRQTQNSMASSRVSSRVDMEDAVVENNVV